MAPAPYPDFRWFFRTLRVLPVVAVAALAGGIIGGFSVFAVNLALTAPPDHSVPPERGSKLASEMTDDTGASSPAPKPPTPMRTFDTATPVAAGATSATAPETAVTAQPASESSAVSTSGLPAVAELAPVSAQEVSPAQLAAAAMASQSGASDGPITVVHPQSNAANEPQKPQSPSPPIAATQSQQTSWPDALSREHRSISTQPATADRPAEPKTTMETTSVSVPSVKPDANANASAMRRHVAIKRPAPPAGQRTGEMSVAHSPVHSWAHSWDHGRALYDDYGREDSRNVDDNPRVRYRAARPQNDARRQPPADIARSGDRDEGSHYDRSDERDDHGSRDALPPQPPPVSPLFGLFGGGDRDGN